MIPLSDLDIQRRSIPFVTGALIVTSVLVFAYQFTLDEFETFLFTYRFGAIPAELLGDSNLAQTYVVVGQSLRPVDVKSPIPNWATIFTSMFMHGGFLHLGGNMLYLWTFGKSIEDRYGHFAFAGLYVVSGVIAAVSQSLVDTDSMVPMVGASGAVAGILGAYIVFYPLSRINTLIFMGLIFTIRVPAVVLLGFWAALQSFNGLASLGPEVASGGVAYLAHLGGFAFGLVVTLIVLSPSASRTLASKARQFRDSRATARAAPQLSEPQRWSSITCPNCGDNLLEFSDQLHRWNCRGCNLYFS